VVIHAGVECGTIAAKIPGLDAVSFGPNMYDVHTVNERLSISSAMRSYDFLLEVLKEI
jgi:dipeptidase D